MSVGVIVLNIAVVAWGVLIGAAVYEHLAVVPVWSSNPPQSLEMFRGTYPVRPEVFWRGIHPLLLLSLAAALALNWSDATVRQPLLIAFGGYIVALIATATFFVPELFRLAIRPSGDVTPADWRARAKRWERLSWVRLAGLTLLMPVLVRAAR